MKPIALKVRKRETLTKGAVNALRAAGGVPGVVYGRGLDPTPVAVDGTELRTILASASNPLLELQCDEPIGGKIKRYAVVAEVQRHLTKGHPIHVDFHAVELGEQVEARVPIELVGKAKGVEVGGVVEPLVHELHVRALPDHMPQAIEVDVSGLGLGEHLTVADLPKSNEYEILDDPGEMVVTVLAPRLAREAAAVEEGEAEES